MRSKTLSYDQYFEVVRTAGKGGWYVYSALLAIINEGGEAQTTLDGISDALGVSKRSLQTELTKLKRIQVKNEPLIKTSKTHDGNVYDVLLLKIATLYARLPHPIINTTLDYSKELKDKGDANRRTKRPNAVETLFQHWLAAYKVRYGVDYRVSNFAKEKGQLRTLIVKYGQDVERLKACVDVVMRLYDSRWKSQQYVRPTIGAFCSFLASQAEPYVQASTDARDVLDDPAVDLDAHDGRFGL